MKPDRPAAMIEEALAGALSDMSLTIAAAGSEHPAADAPPLDRIARHMADQLDGLFREFRADGWTIGCDQGIKWAQGKADRPLRNPYKDGMNSDAKAQYRKLARLALDA